MACICHFPHTHILLPLFRDKCFEIWVSMRKEVFSKHYTTWRGMRNLKSQPPQQFLGNPLKTINIYWYFPHNPKASIYHQLTRKDPKPHIIFYNFSMFTINEKQSPISCKIGVCPSSTIARLWRLDWLVHKSAFCFLFYYMKNQMNRCNCKCCQQYLHCIFKIE